MNDSNWDLPKMIEFEKELTNLINKYSIENGSNTPDYILARYLIRSLQNFEFIHNDSCIWNNYITQEGNKK